MKLFTVMKDGGPESHVWGFWLIEWKAVFSVAVLCFEDGSRESFHSHAFNAISWLFWGQLSETLLETPNSAWWYYPSIWPIHTRRETCHKVYSKGRSWVLTFRGPWASTWQEYLPKEDRFVTLARGRKEVA